VEWGTDHRGAEARGGQKPWRAGGRDREGNVFFNGRLCRPYNLGIFIIESKGLIIFLTKHNWEKATSPLHTY